MKFTDDQLEQLESLRKHRGFEFILQEREEVARKTLFNNSNAKNRDLIQKDTIVHESAIEQIRENNGFLMGIDHIIKLVESAHDKRTKAKNEKKD